MCHIAGELAPGYFNGGCHVFSSFGLESVFLCYNSAGSSDDKSREALERSSGMTLSRMDFSVVLMRSVLATSGSLSFSHTRHLSKGLILR